MRRCLIVLLFASVSLQACAGAQSILFPPANTPGPSATATITIPPTATATSTSTPRPTATTTIIHIPTQDPNLPTATVPIIPIIVEGGLTATLAPANVTPTAFQPGAGFLSISTSESKIFWGSCKHNKTVITAIVEDEKEAFSVVIFTRVKSAKKDDSTPWTNGNVMSDHRDGTYTYVMKGIELEGHNHYRNSWVIFQLVITNIKGEEVGRSRIFDQSIALSPCE